MTKENAQILIPVGLVLLFLTFAIIISFSRGNTEISSSENAAEEKQTNIEQITKPLETITYYKISNINTSGQIQHLLTLQADGIATIETSYLDGRETETQQGKYTQTENSIIVNLEENQIPLTFTKTNGHIVATSFDKNFYGDSLKMKRGNPSSAELANSLSSANWKIVKYANKNTPLKDFSGETSLSFVENENNISFSGVICNQLSGKFSYPEDRSIKLLDSISATKMACENKELTSVENNFIKLAEKGFSITDSEEGNIILANSEENFSIQLRNIEKVAMQETSETAEGFAISEPENSFSGSLACLKPKIVSNDKNFTSGCSLGLYTSDNKYLSILGLSPEIIMTQDLTRGQKVTIKGLFTDAEDPNLITNGAIVMESIVKD